MDTQKETGGIYAITHIETGRQYVGSTQHLAKRWKEHVYLLNLGTHFNRKLQGAWNKYGADAFEHSVVEVVTGGDNLLEREQFHIDAAAPHFNIALSTTAPMRGRQMPPAFSEQMSQRFKGRVFSPEHQAKITASNTGRRHSEGTKAKIAAIRTGTKSTMETRQKLSDLQQGRVISWADKISETLKGHEVSEETRAKIRASLKARRERLEKEKEQQNEHSE